MPKVSFLMRRHDIEGLARHTDFCQQFDYFDVAIFCGHFLNSQSMNSFTLCALSLECSVRTRI